jgi:hypothetical protein
MNESLERSFGIVIAYVLPGFVCLAGASHFSPMIASWMSMTPRAEPTLGAVFYAALGSLTAGLTISAFRWALLDTFYHFTGLPLPNLDFSHLQEKLDAFELAVEHNYRYYQCYAHLAMASGFYGLADQVAHGPWSAAMLAGGGVLEGVLLATSRDCLKRYYRRSEQLLGIIAAPEISVSTGP